ncbi:hypothetical protein DWF00_01605 [Bosea caraganae]|uniref:Uncharacterized protein n=1 Tax=Bosea caraganae TaxID=2763117 RepID=A0A370L924_9HYPH|nr:hypothetical protein [Bosea caraganae]RDJ26900.1 hypothetical protein DWE98_08625 [Bosea caraganae]RDJ30787.1 hypothetical protein DWF00_01605 [Bosea caraganae]
MTGKLRPPSLKDVVKQLRYDWFGKDVQQTPTVSYVWTADQFGHFGLGFQITYLVGWLLAWIFPAMPSWKTAVIAAVLNLALWIVKEVLDIVRERKRQGPLFPLNSRELWWNVATALFYIGAGAIVAGAAGWSGWHAIIALLILLVPAAGLVIWWVRRKMTFQQVGLPFLFRLTNLCSKFRDADAGHRETVVALSTPASVSKSLPGIRHVVVTGAVGSGKTCLACGIGTEYAFRLGIARYTTLTKLFESVADCLPKAASEKPLPELEEQDGRVLWPWRDVELLIVDDVDALLVEPPLPAFDTKPYVEAAVTKRADDQAALREIVRHQLTIVGIDSFEPRRTVWIVSDPQEAAAWRDTIAQSLGLAGDAAVALPIIHLERDEQAILALAATN